MSTELERLLNATAVQPGQPVDLGLVTTRVSRRRQVRTSATFAGAVAAVVAAFSLVGTSIPTSAPVIREVPDRGEPRVEEPVGPTDLEPAVEAGHASTRQGAPEAGVAALPEDSERSVPGPVTGAPNAAEQGTSRVVEFSFDGTMDGFAEGGRTPVDSAGGDGLCAQGNAYDSWYPSDRVNQRFGLAMSYLAERCESVFRTVEVPIWARAMEVEVVLSWPRQPSGVASLDFAWDAGDGWRKHPLPAPNGRPNDWLTGVHRADLPSERSEDWSLPIAFFTMASSQPPCVAGTRCFPGGDGAVLVIDRLTITWIGADAGSAGQEGPQS